VFILRDTATKAACLSRQIAALLFVVSLSTLWVAPAAAAVPAVECHHHWGKHASLETRERVVQNQAVRDAQKMVVETCHHASRLNK
jgi:hypothetical protein